VPVQIVLALPPGNEELTPLDCAAASSHQWLSAETSAATAAACAAKRFTAAACWPKRAFITGNEDSAAAPVDWLAVGRGRSSGRSATSFDSWKHLFGRDVTVNGKSPACSRCCWRSGGSVGGREVVGGWKWRVERRSINHPVTSWP